MDKEAIIEIDGKRHRVTIHEATEGKVKRWRANKDSSYWRVSNRGNVMPYYEFYDAFSDWGIQTRNYFKTKEEAEHELHRITTVNKIRDRIEELNDGWVADVTDVKYYVVNTFTDGISVRGCNNFLSAPKWMYFKSEEIGKTLIEEFGDDLKLLFE